MANKIFEYGDIVYFLDSKGKIDTGTFSEEWGADGCVWSYVNQRGHQIHVLNENLFDSEINLLLSLEKKKIKAIETSKSLIVKIQNNLPLLEQELVEIRNKIKKIEKE